MRCKTPVSLGNICTGMNKCYNNTAAMTCPLPEEEFFGQDAQYATSCIPQSFTRLSSSIVVDNNTGLTWETSNKNSNSWSSAKYYCNNTLNNNNYAGFSDWRLPTPREFLSIADNSVYKPAINTNYFQQISNSDALYFWTTQPYGSNQVQLFRPAYGTIFHYNFTQDDSDHVNVVCVRGTALPQASFETQTLNGQDVVKDVSSGLMWQKEYEESKTWQQALDYCKNLTYAGFSDWRLPNKNEAASLLNNDLTETPYSDFPDMPDSNFWTSSNRVDDLARAWTIRFSESDTNNPVKTEQYNVRCVRLGICEEDEFWNRTECIHNPCYENPCSSYTHSTGACFPTDETTYSCSCESGYFWSGTECVNPCADDPCGTEEHTVCTSTSSDTYTCSCNNANQGYIWIDPDSQCQKRKWSFEDDGSDTSSGLISVSGWARMSDLGAKTGSYAKCSTNYGNNGYTSSMTITVNMPEAGTVSFYIRGSAKQYKKVLGSGYSYYGNFYFSIDSSEKISTQEGWSGWTQKTYNLTAGTHTLHFSYEKEEPTFQTDSRGDDRFCIDDLAISY